MHEKLTITGEKRVEKTHLFGYPPSSKICFWSLWFSKLTISFKVVSGPVLFRTCMLQSASLMLLVGASCFLSLLVTKSLLQFVFENFDRILHELYFLNWYKFLTRALSSLLNGRLRHKCIVTALKIIIYNNVDFFVYKHKKCVYNYTFFNFTIKISRKLF